MSVSRETFEFEDLPNDEVLTFYFKNNVNKIKKYAEFLSFEGTKRGLIGPRESKVLWDRHILNCVTYKNYFNDDTTVLDIGSGAGLPAIPLLLANPSLKITALEPLQRRVDFLKEATELLDINLKIVRGRAEDKNMQKEIKTFNYVTSRAVANILKLSQYAKPFLNNKSFLVVLKGNNFEKEFSENKSNLEKLGFTDWKVAMVGEGVTSTPTYVVTSRLK